MGGTGRKKEPPKKNGDKPKKRSARPVEEEDYEDGDIATPKRDRPRQMMTSHCSAGALWVLRRAGQSEACPPFVTHCQPPRHCERSEAIHRATEGKNGLLRCARK
jgi:hypothetical protein